MQRITAPRKQLLGGSTHGWVAVAFFVGDRYILRFPPGWIMMWKLTGDKEVGALESEERRRDEELKKKAY